MKLNKRMQIACELVSRLTDKPQSVSELFTASQTNVRYIASQLVKSGLIRSVRGRVGGYVVERPVTFAEVSRAMTEDTGEHLSSLLEMQLNDLLHTVVLNEGPKVPDIEYVMPQGWEIVAVKE